MKPNLIDRKPGDVVDHGNENGIYVFKAQGEIDAFQAVVIGPMRFAPGKIARALSEREGKTYLVHACATFEPAPTLAPVVKQAILDRGIWSIIFAPAA